MGWPRDPEEVNSATWFLRSRANTPQSVSPYLETRTGRLSAIFDQEGVPLAHVPHDVDAQNRRQTAAAVPLPDWLDPDTLGAKSSTVRSHLPVASITLARPGANSPHISILTATRPAGHKPPAPTGSCPACTPH